jgi:catechol 2,3-dioxygenase-like lactoylglutathione lyase family enzyme
MSVQLNHTIVPVRDKRVAAEYYAEMLGLPAPLAFGPFLVVELANGVSLDFADDQEPGPPRHYAFLVSEAEFDAVLGRIRTLRLPFYADPGGKVEGEYNTHDGGRGLYWADPDGNWLEIITRPYGGG